MLYRHANYVTRAFQAAAFIRERELETPLKHTVELLKADLKL